MAYRGGGAYNLEDFVGNLESWGLTDVLLPFLLIFTIVFAILQKSRILGNDKKNFNMVIALVMGLLVVIPHVTSSYPQDYDVVDIINESLPAVSLVIVAIVMLLLLVGLFGAEVKWGGSSISGWIAIISFIIIIYIFGAAADWWEGWNWFNNFFGDESVAIVIVLLVFGIIIAFITGSESDNKGKANVLTRIGDEFKNFFGGGGSNG